MEAKQIATVSFFDEENRSDACAIVRTTSGSIGLTLSLMKDGDVECFLDVDTAKKIVNTLEEAIHSRDG